QPPDEATEEAQAEEETDDSSLPRAVDLAQGPQPDGRPDHHHGPEAEGGKGEYGQAGTDERAEIGHRHSLAGLDCDDDTVLPSGEGPPIEWCHELRPEGSHRGRPRR